MEIKNKIGLKGTIELSAFIGFIGSFLFFMWMYPVENINIFKWVITIWCCFWMIMMIFGFNKGSIMAFGAALIKIATDKTLTNTDKIAYILLTIQEWANITANMQMIETLKTETEKIVPVVKKIEKIIEPIV